MTVNLLTPRQDNPCPHSPRSRTSKNYNPAATHYSPQHRPKCARLVSDIPVWSHDIGGSAIRLGSMNGRSAPVGYLQDADEGSAVPRPLKGPSITASRRSSLETVMVGMVHCSLAHNMIVAGFVALFPVSWSSSASSIWGSSSTVTDFRGQLAVAGDAR